MDEFKEGFNTVLEKISKYNESIVDWYDEKYYSDKNKLYKSIEDEETKLFVYEKSDFISIGYTD